MGKIERVKEIQTEHGSVEVVKRVARYVVCLPSPVYNETVWPRLPRTAAYGTYNDVKIVGRNPLQTTKSDVDVAHRCFDDVVPWETPSHIPTFKQPNVNQLNQHCTDGDHVVVVGGGYGVTAVHAAKQVGDDGTVTIYEGDTSRIKDLKRTLAYNGVAERCRVITAIVGSGYHIDNTAADHLEPSDLPECDILEMDCEGAELDILLSIDNVPRTVIVELHHRKSFAPYSSPAVIKKILEAHGYAVEQADGTWVDGLSVGTRERH